MTPLTCCSVVDALAADPTPVALHPQVVSALAQPPAVRVMCRYGISPLAGDVAHRVYEVVGRIIAKDLLWYGDPCRWPFPSPILPLYQGLSRTTARPGDILRRARQICARADLIALLEYRRNCYAHAYLDSRLPRDPKGEEREEPMVIPTGEFDEVDLVDPRAMERVDVYESPGRLEAYVREQTVRCEQSNKRRNVADAIDQELRHYLHS